MRQGGSWATKGSTFCRASRFFTTTFPWTSTPWTHTTFFAISIPSVVTCAMVDSPTVQNGYRSYNHRDLSQVTCTVGGSIPLVWGFFPNSPKKRYRTVAVPCPHLDAVQTPEVSLLTFSTGTLRRKWPSKRVILINGVSLFLPRG